MTRGQLCSALYNSLRSSPGHRWRLHARTRSGAEGGGFYGCITEQNCLILSFAHNIRELSSLFSQVSKGHAGGVSIPAGCKAIRARKSLTSRKESLRLRLQNIFSTGERLTRSEATSKPASQSRDGGTSESLMIC